MVFDDAYVSGYAEVAQNAIVCGRSKVANNALVYGHAFVKDSYIIDDAVVGDYAKLTIGVSVGGGSNIGGNMEITNAITVQNGSYLRGNSKIHHQDDFITFQMWWEGNETMEERQMTYISLFSSAGVGCYGFKQNGFQCIATCELLKDRLNIQRCNHKCKYETGYIDGDLTSNNVKETLFNEVEHYKLIEHINTVDVILATPPCQGISSANCKKTDNDHKRNSLIVEAISIIDRIQPNVFVFENVPRFLQTLCTDIDGVDKTIKDAIFSNLGQKYNIYYDVINFKDYGVPSSRNRTIVIGVKRTITSLKPITLFPSKQKRITLKEAIGYLPHLEFAQKDKNDPFHFARPFKH